jgi:hypothetical protein
LSVKQASESQIERSISIWLSKFGVRDGYVNLSDVSTPGTLSSTADFKSSSILEMPKSPGNKIVSSGFQAALNSQDGDGYIYQAESLGAGGYVLTLTDVAISDGTTVSCIGRGRTGGPAPHLSRGSIFTTILAVWW